MYIEGAPPGTAIRYNDRGSYRWLWSEAPCAWKQRVEFHFSWVPLSSLQPAGCLLDPAIIAAYLERMRNGRELASPVVSAAEPGRWYIHDGNHRYRALRSYYAAEDAPIRVAIAVPKEGYEFRYRWFGKYGSYRLQPVSSLLSTTTPGPFGGRTMVLVAHQDDETACAGLLQRMTTSIVVYATNGAPADEYFWRRYGSRFSYSAIRRAEAKAALAKARVLNFEFLSDHVPAGTEFCDQRLHCVLPQALEAVSDLVRGYRPDTLLVPAYEGGHPDHDSCGFLGSLLGRRFGLPVWEMPLYHRSQSGELVCRRFWAPNGNERRLVLSADERRTRDCMIATYESQRDVADFVSGDVEQYRMQERYDYSRPPHPGTVNYEWWRWAMSANEVCRSFQDCLELVRESPGQGFAALGAALSAAATAAPAEAG